LREPLAGEEHLKRGEKLLNSVAQYRLDDYLLHERRRKCNASSGTDQAETGMIIFFKIQSGCSGKRGNRAIFGTT